MAYPPTIPPNNRANSTATPDNHRDDHNETSDALTDLVTVLGSDPAGASADVTDRLAALDTTVGGKIPLTIIDAAADLIVGTAADTAGRLAKGTAYQKPRMNSGATAIEWATTTYRAIFPWALNGTGATDVLPGFFVSLPTGQTAQAVKIRYATISGTATVKVLKNGSDLTGFTSLSVSSTPASTTPTAQALADDDRITLEITAASSPVDLMVSLFVDFVIP